VRGQALNFSGSFADVGTLDTHDVRWDFGDGTVIDFHSTSDPNALTTPAHIYTDSGVYTLTLSIRDDDGGVTSVSKAITITAVALQVDPRDPTKTALVVGGTTGNDTIVLNPQGNLGDINVTINGVSQGVFHPTGHLIVFGQDGDDDIEVAGSIALDVLLYGDAGNDHLKGGAGSGILVGGDGDDMLIGGSGRNILIGGDGKDRLVGGSGDDILISGFTSFDTNVVFLCTLMDGWSAPGDSYATRIARLRLLLNGTTITNDGDADKLTGSSGLDWFFVSSGDVITDLKAGESNG
jgi:Ca2+-binding RTX toxin-like protein